MSEYDPFNLPEPTAEERQQKHFPDSNGLWLMKDVCAVARHHVTLMETYLIEFTMSV